MDLGLNGKRAIVCASSHGLGRACAMALAQAGASVVLNGRDGAALDATAAAIGAATGVRVATVAGDVAEDATQAALVAAADGVPDILVNNNGGPPLRDFRALDAAAIHAGLDANMVTPIRLTQRVVDGMMERGFGRIVNNNGGPPLRDFRALDAAAIHAGLDANMVTPIRLTQRVVDGMMERGFGRIVCVTSASVKAPTGGLDLSSGARVGLTGFLAGVARQVAGSNVTINFLLPGLFATRRLDGVHAYAAKAQGVSEEEAAARARARIPAGRFGDPDEFGRACAFLCSAHAGFITGQSLLIDGGAYPGVL